MEEIRSGNESSRESIQKDSISKNLPIHKANIVACGQTGVGKSTILNGILGKDLSQVARVPFSESRNLKEVTLKDCIDLRIIEDRANNVEIKVYETGTLILVTEIERECSNIDLFLYCISIKAGMLAEDEYVLKDLYRFFKNNIWKNSIIVLTFANQGLELSPPRSLESKCQVINEEKTRVQQIFQSKGIDISLAQIIPAGSISKPSLLNDGKFWLSDIWNAAINVTTQEVGKTLVLINSYRIKESHLVTSDANTGVPLEKQWIVPAKSNPQTTKRKKSNSQTSKRAVTVYVSNELYALQENTRDLELALKDNHDVILEDLNNAGLVKSGVYSCVKNVNSRLSSAEKAILMVTSIREGVEVQPANFHKFITILKKSERHFSDIIRKLEQIFCARAEFQEFEELLNQLSQEVRIGYSKLSKLCLDNELLDSKCRVELMQSSQKLSSARTSFEDFLRSYKNFFTCATISKDTSQKMMESLEINNFEPVDKCLKDINQALLECQYQLNDFQKKLHEAERKCKETQRICKIKEAPNKTTAAAVGIVGGTIAATAATIAAAVLTAGIAAPVAAGVAAGIGAGISTAAVKGGADTLSYARLEKKFNKLYEAMAISRNNAARVGQMITKLDKKMQNGIVAARRNAKQHLQVHQFEDYFKMFLASIQGSNNYFRSHEYTL